MIEGKLIIRNVRKNIQDYMIYFLTLTVSVSMFYAFNSIQTQPALNDLDTTKQMLSDQLGILLSVLSVVVAIVLAFLILYANQFLLKRRKKELGIYTLLGMEKGKISKIFAGETLCVGILSLVFGIILGLLLSQGLSIFSLRLFAIDMSKFQIVFSISALKKTISCFVLIFLIVMIFNVRTVSSVRLIDLLTAGRKNEVMALRNKAAGISLAALSILCIVSSGVIIQHYGILPSRENSWFQIAVVLLAAGTALFFFSVSAVLLTAIQANRKIYLKGLNTFLSRQIGSKVQTDFMTMSIVCALLTISICGISVGISSALTMNETSKAALPYDLNVVADIDVAGETDIAAYLKSRDVDMGIYADSLAQISLYEAEITYGDLFEGQDLNLWHIDENIPEMGVSVVSISDFNRALAAQGKSPINLADNEFLLNCNYKGTLQYIDSFLQSCTEIDMNGTILQLGGKKPLGETVLMTSVGNNDRGTFIVPDHIAASLAKDMNILLVQYKPGINTDEILQKMIPIGLEWETEGYRYTEKNMLSSMYYGSCALLVFLCCYIGLVFLLICAALLSLKQLTETADNIYRYGLLQKLGTDSRLLFGALFKQIAIFFASPLLLAGMFSVFGIGKITAIVEEFLNMHISTNIGITVLMFLIVYGGYFIATYLSCKHMVMEKQISANCMDLAGVR
ncbi:FtsX-like permease family protein [Lachnospiraceae bacterium 56-18]|uniref:FtsX-like permease family protein n=1 Tax=Sporofaciens sp. JLR.KK001 TaxID=3112621 RepID=UPI002FF20A0D